MCCDTVLSLTINVPLIPLVWQHKAAPGDILLPWVIAFAQNFKLIINSYSPL